MTNLGRWYLFGLEGNQPHLYGFARVCQHYSIGKRLARTTEKYRGHTIVRELFARTVAGHPEPTSRTPSSSGTSARRRTAPTARAPPWISGTS